MQQHSKHLSEFNSNQILQIVKWGREKYNHLTKEWEKI